MGSQMCVTQRTGHADHPNLSVEQLLIGLQCRVVAFEDQTRRVHLRDVIDELYQAGVTAALAFLRRVASYTVASTPRRRIPARISLRRSLRSLWK